MSAEISIEQFNAAINSNQSVLVLFYMQASPHCKMLLLDFSELIPAYEEQFTMLKADLMEMTKNRELAELYEVEFVPTLIYFKNGKEIDRFIGNQGKWDLKSWLDKYLIRK